jgi:hypothetical protein
VIVLTGSDDPSPAWLKSIEEGRRNPVAWIYVVEVAIPAVYGVSKFDAVNIKSNKIMESLMKHLEQGWS